MSENIPQTALVPDSDYVIFGGTGDLALRKIFPALFWRFLDGQVNAGFRLMAVARTPTTLEDFLVQLRPYCEDAFTQGMASEKDWEAFASLISLFAVDIVSGDGSAALHQAVVQKLAQDRPVIFYLAIAPSLFGAACALLDKLDLVLPQSRLVVEKPLGNDRASSEEINLQLRDVFDEHQIYRIDHYLGKETVQNLMALRFANVIFESQWSNKAIDHVQITVAETVGVGNRASYYDKSGALRDMVQNHILQLVCLVAMEPPSHFTADQVRDEKLRVLQALRPLKEDDIVTGQYQDYESELGQSSDTETYVALRMGIENWRWAGVPFYIRTGKKMALRASEIVITFKPKPHDIFSPAGTEHTEDLPNRLIIRLQPEEGLKLQLISKAPGPGGMRLFPSELNLSFDDTFSARLPDAYERLLMDTARGNQTLFMRHDEVLAAWSFIDPVIELATQRSPVLYRPATFGPADHFAPENTTGSEGNTLWIDPVASSEEA